MIKLRLSLDAIYAEISTNFGPGVFYSTLAAHGLTVCLPVRRKKPTHTHSHWHTHIIFTSNLKGGRERGKERGRREVRGRERERERYERGEREREG